MAGLLLLLKTNDYQSLYRKPKILAPNEKNDYITIGLLHWEGKKPIFNMYKYHWILGKFIYQNEYTEGMVIHHKNLNKLDNSIENLLLLKKGTHDRLHNEVRKIQISLNKSFAGNSFYLEAGLEGMTIVILTNLLE